MLKQKTTIARGWILRVVCGIAMCLLVMWFRGDLPLRAVLGQSQEGPPVETTIVDSDAMASATFQSHNQKVVANAYGIFMTYLHKQQCCLSIGNSCCDKDDPLCFNPATQTCRDAGKEIISTWRLSRSTDGGATFTTVYEGKHGTAPPAIETDSQGNIYLARTDWFQGGLNSYVMRFLANNNFQNPTRTTLTGAWGTKFAMEIDEARGQLYFFSNSNKFFRVRLSDLAVLAEYQLLRNGDSASMQYPYFYLDDNGHLYLAWTTQRNPALNGQCGNDHWYWSIHFMRSLDGGVTWVKPNGQRLEHPILADHDGPTDEITPIEERCRNTWLSTFLVKGDKVHFVYNAHTTSPRVSRQHYVRYDLAMSRIDRTVFPDNISIETFSGVLATRRSIKEIFFVGMSHSENVDSRIVVLKSEDNGGAWRDHALGPISPTYALGGSPQVTDDGKIIGSYTQSPKIAKFFKVASLAEPSRKDVVFTAGDLELAGGGQDCDEFAATASSPAYVVGQSGLNHVRGYIGYSYGDPSGGNKAQFLQLTNLTIGNDYTVDVYPSGNYGDGNCYYATAISGGTVVSGGCMGWLTTGQFQSITNRWRIVVRAESQTMTLRIGNFRDENNSDGVSRFLLLDAIGVKSN